MNNFGSMSLYIDNKNTKSKPISIPKRKPAIWMPDKRFDRCFKCNVQFGMLLRKHHCRACGRIFCSECSQWNCKSNSLISIITPPNNNYFYDKFQKYIYNDKRLCEECYSHYNTVKKDEDLIIILQNLPFLMIDLCKLRLVSKKWCKIINYILSVYRSIQYKLPSNNFSKLERDILWNHRFEFKNHYYWITKCLIANHERNKDEMKKLIVFYYSNKIKKSYSCKSLLCRHDCKNHCGVEHILQIGYKVDIQKHFLLQNYIVELLLKKNVGILQLITPWIINLSTQYPKLGGILCYKCKDLKSIFNLYYELKYLLTFKENKNLQSVFKTLKSKMTTEVANEIRKTDEFIKFVSLILNKRNIDDVALSISKFFCLNLYIMMPWDPSILCTHIDYQNIKQLSSASKPWMFPLIVKNNNDGKTYQQNILIKNEDIRKDKLTMTISSFINIVCDEKIMINTYNVLPISLNYGWIEIIDDCKTLYNLETTGKSLTNHLMDINPNISIGGLRENFIKTCVASCVLCYILGIGDRHNENILINKYGDIVHIDFSYLLGDDPKNISSEMRITPGMLELLGGKNSSTYIKFKKYCSVVYKKIRRHSSLWYLLLTYLAFSDPPIDNYRNNYELIKLHVIDRLLPGEFDDQSSININKVLDESNDGWKAHLGEVAHRWSNNFKQIASNLTTQFNIDL